MGVKFFGQYLVENKVVTREALRKAVELQRKVNLLFGATARSMGMLTDADIERVHAEQRKQDLNFGDMCVKLGILAQDQVKQVLEQQKSNHLHLGDALVRTNAIKADALPALLESFDADQAPSLPKEEAPAPIPNEDLWESYADLTCKMFTRVVNLKFKPGPRSLADGIDPNDTIVAVRMTGDAPCKYLLSVCSEVRDHIARAIMKTDDISSEPKEVLVDAVKEFTNIVCGNMAAKASELGKNIEPGYSAVLDVQDRFSPSEGAKGLLFPLHVAEGCVEFAIFWEE